MAFRPGCIPVRHTAEFRRAEVLHEEIRSLTTTLSDLLHDIAVKEESRHKQATALLLVGAVNSEVCKAIKEVRLRIPYIDESGCEVH